MWQNYLWARIWLFMFLKLNETNTFLSGLLMKCYLESIQFYHFFSLKRNQWRYFLEQLLQNAIWLCKSTPGSYFQKTNFCKWNEALLGIEYMLNPSLMKTWNILKLHMIKNQLQTILAIPCTHIPGFILVMGGFTNKTAEARNRANRGYLVVLKGRKIE